MQKRVCSLIRMQAPDNADGALLSASGATVPTDATVGYRTGCIFQHTDGTSGTSLYVNEGTATSCAFKALASSGVETLAGLSDVGALAYSSGKILVADGDSYEEVAITGKVSLTSAGVTDIALLTATAGITTASKALIVDAYKALDRLFVGTAPVSYLLPAMSVGVYGTPVVDTAVIDNIAFTVNISTATNKTDENTSCMAAYFGCANTAATTNNKLQGVLASTNVGYNCFDAYAVQGHTTIGAGGVSTKNANAHLTGVSGKAVLTGAVGQGWVTGVLAIIEGAGAVTGLCHVIAAQVEATCTDSVVDAILFLGADALATAAIEISDVAHVTNFLKLSASSGCLVTNALVPSEAPAIGTVGADKALVIDVGGTPYYIALYDTLKV
jgi:hypothetical protein